MKVKVRRVLGVTFIEQEEVSKVSIYLPSGILTIKVQGEELEVTLPSSFPLEEIGKEKSPPWILINPYTCTKETSSDYQILYERK